MTNGDLPRIRLHRSKHPLRRQRWRWSLVVLDAARRECVIATGAEGYANRDDCVHMALKVVSGAYADAVTDLR